MARVSSLERVLGKAILDSDFRAKLLEDPEAAAKSLRIQLTVAQAVAIRNIDRDLLEWWAQGFQTLKGEDPGFLW